MDKVHKHNPFKTLSACLNVIGDQVLEL